MSETKTEDGWIIWPGGPCPVPPETRVEVEFRSGKIFGEYNAAYWGGRPYDFWKHEAADEADIVAYRVVRPAPPPRSPPATTGVLSIIAAVRRDYAECDPRHYGAVEACDRIEAAVRQMGVGHSMGSPVDPDSGDHLSESQRRRDAVATLTAVKAERDAARAQAAALAEALEFYADEKGWKEPPIETLPSELFGPAYRNRASEIRTDRGKKARTALAAYDAQKETGE